MSASPGTATEAAAHPGRRRALGIGAAVVAVVVIAIAFVVGFGGLLANPVQSQNPDGTVTLHGTFEPYQCGTRACNGYVQAGARSVFVQFPPGCSGPQRAATITVVGRPAPDLGSQSYRATTCV